MSWQDEAGAHFCATYPREGCGLLVRTDDGSEIFLAAQNRAHSPQEQFSISAEDFANAEDRGELLAVVHSHPDYPARPSMADRSQCEASGVPWYIFRVDGREHAPRVLDVVRIEPEGFSAPLVGREFAYGIHDCYALFRDWYRQERGIELPEFDHGPDRWWDKTSPNYLPDFDPYTENLERAGFERVAGPLQVGDGILMQIRADKPNHIGVYLGDGIMLHHLRGRLSDRVPYGGYWKDMTCYFIRRKVDNAE